ncbi:MAG: hypothetical protein WAU70_14000 [Flavobacteriales bacterium]
MRRRFIGLLITFSTSLGTVQQATACTLFKITKHGRTLVGNHEDAWSINARVRFVNGKNGAYGALYFSHYNGSPLRTMSDQGGMNEAGLVFDGFVVPVTELRAQHGPIADIGDLVSRVMRTCADVHQAGVIFREHDLSPLNGGMLFFCDRNGEYLVVEADTVFTGADSTFTLGNFRPSQCTDLGAVPIARFQRGRAMLALGSDTSLSYCTTLLDSMSVCRRKIGEGTLYSYLADPSRGSVQLFFHHDFAHRVTFNLKEELAKGDHELEMATLFPKNEEYERLLSFKTPFHQRWLWWSITGIGVLSLLCGLWALAMVPMWIVACIRSRSLVTELPWLSVGLASAISVFLCGTLLFNEGVYYFGLGDTLDRIHPVLKWAPLALMLCVLAVGVHQLRHARYRTSLRIFFAFQALLVVGLGYWGLLIP